jgi:predicted esterase
VWLACHGYGQLAARFLRAFAHIAGPSRLIVAPEALNRYYTDGRIAPHTAESEVGATWMTREDRLNEIEDYIRYLDLLCAEILRGVDRDRVALVALGFSQGVATIARWAARTVVAPDHVVLWGSLLPPELAPVPGMFGGARLVLAAGESDAALPPQRLESERSRLRAAGVDHDVLRFRGGHRIEREALTELAERVRAS